MNLVFTASVVARTAHPPNHARHAWSAAGWTVATRIDEDKYLLELIDINFKSKIEKSYLI